MTSARLTLLYIAGCGRSGSSLLGLVLGQLAGWSYIGEAIWSDPRRLTRRLCGCGLVLGDCEFWREVGQALDPESGPGRVPAFLGLGRRARWRHLPLTFARDPARRLESFYGERWRSCRRLYPSVAAVSGAGVIVDSSKSVPYARMLALMPELDVRVVHLVRDARAVAHSWRRLKPAPDRLDHPYMRQLTPARVALLWATSNLGAELFCRRAPDRYLRVRYEDFIARPRDCIDRISRMTTGKPAALPWVGEHALEIRATHSVSGNPARLATGRVELTLDAEWKTAMPPTDRRLTTALTWPLLLRYGYLRGS